MWQRLKLSCEKSFKNWKLQTWKRISRGRHPLKKVKVEDVKAKLSRVISKKTLKLAWKPGFVITSYGSYVSYSYLLTVC